MENRPHLPLSNAPPEERIETRGYGKIQPDFHRFSLVFLRFLGPLPGFSGPHPRLLGPHPSQTSCSQLATSTIPPGLHPLGSRGGESHAPDSILIVSMTTDELEAAWLWRSPAGSVHIGHTYRKSIENRPIGLGWFGWGSLRQQRLCRRTLDPFEPALQHATAAWVWLP